MRSRTGLLACKLGMTSVYRDRARVPVTVLSVDGCRVVGHHQVGQLHSVAVGIGVKKNPSKPMLGAMRARGQSSVPQAIREFRVSPDALPPMGAVLAASHFVVGQKVDISGITNGKGFQGPMKRHNFGGLCASHGVSVSHRSHGSTGQCQDPGKVFKGRAMAGHMGHVRATQKNVEVLKFDESRCLIFVKGGVPGVTGSVVEIRDAVNVPVPQAVPFPAALSSSSEVSP